MKCRKLSEADTSTLVGDVCQQLGVSEATFYARRKKYAHRGVSDRGAPLVFEP
jgi:putative transposase